MRRTAPAASGAIFYANKVSPGISKTSFPIPITSLTVFVKVKRWNTFANETYLPDGFRKKGIGGSIINEEPNSIFSLRPTD
jgi:hypothetical protein